MLNLSEIDVSRWPHWLSDDGNVLLINADCLEVLPVCIGVDLFVTSPPYNQKIDTFQASGFVVADNSSWASRVATAYSDSINEYDYQIQQAVMLDACYDAGRDGSSIFYNHKCRWRDKELIHPLTIFCKSKWKLRQEIVWARDGSLTQNAKMFPPSEERVIWGFRNSWSWNADSNRYMSVWRINSEKRSEHPVAFPVELPLRCIEATTDAWGLVCDPYSGSATTGVACVRLGRQFIGIEKEPKYYEIAIKRIKAEQERFPLFEKPIKQEAKTLPGFE